MQPMMPLVTPFLAALLIGTPFFIVLLAQQKNLL